MIRRFFAPMRREIDKFYDELDRAMFEGDLITVLEIEEKLDLLKYCENSLRRITMFVDVHWFDLRPYSARFVADQTIPDGTKVRGGEKFQKVWTLHNDGSMPWGNDDVQLINLFDAIEIVGQAKIPVTAPYQCCSISVDFVAPSTPGYYESKWILSVRNRTFGPLFWCTIEVTEENIDMSGIPMPSCFDLSQPFIPNADQTEQMSRILNDPLDIFSRLGYQNREENQRLLEENNKNMNRVLDILSSNHS